MALRHDGPITAQDEADWRLIAQLAEDARQHLALAQSALSRIYDDYGDSFGVLYRLSDALPKLRIQLSTARGIGMMAGNRAYLCRAEHLRRQATPLWLLRPDEQGKEKA